MFQDWLAAAVQLAQALPMAPTHATPQLQTDVVFTLFGVLPVTNTMLTASSVTAVLIGVAALIRLRLGALPMGVQNAAELFVETWLAIAVRTGGRRARRFVPLVGTAFVFILAANVLGTLPLKHLRVVNANGQPVELFRAATSDLNLTAAIALIVVLVVELLEVYSLGMRRYLKSLVIPNPMRWLEMLVRPLSLAFRLFGSVFAGHVLVGTMLTIAPLVLLPFLALELFMGLIQAIIFAMLALVFLSIATAHDLPELDPTAAHEAAA
jgi:F-type H+-transporting ATPase subunit a